MRRRAGRVVEIFATGVVAIQLVGVVLRALQGSAWQRPAAWGVALAVVAVVLVGDWLCMRWLRGR
jgi:hypothetical protein